MLDLSSFFVGVAVGSIVYTMITVQIFKYLKKRKEAKATKKRRP